MPSDKSQAARLLEIVAEHGLQIDHRRTTTGTRERGFCVLSIGTGATYGKLFDLKRAIAEAGLGAASITNVDNPEHPQYGQLFLELRSFWWEE